MIDKCNKSLILLLIIFAGADRINFGVNVTDSFKLTPFILLSIIYLPFTLTFYIKKIKLNWLVDNQFFLSSFTLFLCLVIMSAVFSPAIIMSSKRIVLLLLIIIIIIIVLSEYDASQINNFLIYSSIAGSILFLIFNGLLLSTWLKIIQIDLPQIDFIPDTIAYYIPRLGGFSGDVNRGGFILSFYTYILWINRKKIKFSGFLLCINLLMIFLTLSRSTYLLLFILFFSYALLFQRHLFNIAFISYLIIPLLVLIVGLIQMDNIGIIKIGPVIEERLTVTSDKGASASIHFDLIAKGTKLILSDMKYFFVGIGHGVSYLLTDGYYWSGTKYGNFHSQYLSIFIENGVFAFFSFLFFTFIYPIYHGNNNIFLPLLIGLIFFNIFYQLTNEPTYWLIILLFYKFQNDGN